MVVEMSFVIINTAVAAPLSLTLPRKGGGNGESRGRGCLRFVARRFPRTPLSSLPPCAGGRGGGWPRQSFFRRGAPLGPLRATPSHGAPPYTFDTPRPPP